MEGKIKSGELSPLALAYLGDAVFELCVRSHLTTTKNLTANRLHREAKNYVSAAAQGKIIQWLHEHLTEDEQRVFKRGRNATSHTVPKNALLADYRRATGLEAIFGYLHIEGKTERINELFALVVQKVTEQPVKQNTGG